MEMYYLRDILGCIKRADNDYKLIEDGDTIAVGVSGGKDSVLLLYALNAYKRMCEKTKKFEIIGIHIKMGFPNMDPSPMETYFKEQNIRFECVPSQAYEILQANIQNNGRLPCSICSKIKKAVVIESAKNFGCNKVAFAHHSEDAIETIMMNMIFGGRIATFKPKMYLDRSDITFIRPFVYAREKLITKSANKLDLPIVVSTCPNDKHTERENIKNMLKDIYEKYPMAEDNFLLMLHNLEKLDLWEKEKED
jgi:tRNA(Ile)-lysidine synthase TilS/MesJ